MFPLLIHIMAAVSFVIPILVMTTMMDGTVTTDTNIGVKTTMEAFDSVWQSIGSDSGSA